MIHFSAFFFFFVVEWTPVFLSFYLFVVSLSGVSFSSKHIKQTIDPFIEMTTVFHLSFHILILFYSFFFIVKMI